MHEVADEVAVYLNCTYTTAVSLYSLPRNPEENKQS